MKIALIAPSNLPARRANTLQVMKMAQALTILGHNVRVLVPVAEKYKSHQTPLWNDLAAHYGLRHKFTVEWLFAHPRLRRYDYGYRTVWYARQWQADLVYTRLPQTAVFAGWIGMDTIFEIHDLPQGILGPWLFHRFLKARGARRLVVITRALKSDLVKQFSAPDSAPFTVVALDGVDLERYVDLPEPQEARRKLYIDDAGHIKPERFTVGYTGHLYYGRGAKLLLELATRLPTMTFLLVGGEPQDVDSLRAETEVRGLDNVVLTGFVPNADLPRFQAACDVLIMPYQRKVAGSSGGDISRYLSPMKLFEYLACGRAILSSDLPVFREVLSERNAVLLPPEDVRAWVTKLEELRDNPEIRAALSSQALHDAKCYTWEARAERILEGLERKTRLMG